MIKTISLLFALAAFSLHAQSDVNNQYDSQINYYLFNGNWQKSDSLIDAKLILDRNSLRYNFFKAYNRFYTRYLANNNPFSRDETIRQVKKYAWEAIQNGEDLEPNSLNNFYLGASYAFLARANVMEQDFWLAYWNASKAENFFEDVIDENPEFADAYLNLGIFEYFPAVNITGLQSVLAWLGGMSGDRELGIEYITETAEMGTLFKYEAFYVLGLLYNFGENNAVQAYDYWKTLSEDFPLNNNFRIQANRSYLVKLVDERGVEFLTQDYNHLDSLYGINNPADLNLLGYNLMNRNKMDAALEVFKINVKKYPEIANSYDSLAECYFNRGENENAVKYYKIAFEKLKTDTTITDQFREFLEENIRNRLRELSSDMDV